MEMNGTFWRGKRVLVTGHTGFKGSWLSLWLHRLGAQVHGYALQPPTVPNLFESANVHDVVHSTIEDIRDATRVRQFIQQTKPEIVFHLAAQPLVVASYQDPAGTYATNVMGTVHVLEAVRHTDSVQVLVNVTSDKCYENSEWVWGYRETDPMGGDDPYSNSKGCAELVTASYRKSFFHSDAAASRPTGIASARAGNVIGGGDWAKLRLIPDIIRAFQRGEPVILRRPEAIRPWQHVLEPLSGYLLLAEKLWNDPRRFSQSWNFGPADSDAQPVESIVRRMSQLWGHGATWRVERDSGFHEASFLKLDCSKARTLLGWTPTWNLHEALAATIAWYQACFAGADLRAICLEQITQFEMAHRKSAPSQAMMATI